MKKIEGARPKLYSIEITVKELRALLFWAGVGVCGKMGGSYERNIENIIEKYANEIGFNGFISLPRFISQEVKKKPLIK